MSYYVPLSTKIIEFLMLYIYMFYLHIFLFLTSSQITNLDTFRNGLYMI